MAGHDNENAAFTESSGNIYADLGIEHDAVDELKASLARGVSALISERRLTVASAAKFLSIDQEIVSSLTRGRLSELSVEQLESYRSALR